MESLNGNPFGIQGEPQNVEENKIDESKEEQQVENLQPIENALPEKQSNETVANNERVIDVFEIFNISWKIFKANVEFLVILTLIYFGIRFAESMAERPVDKGSAVLILATILIAAFNILIAIGMVQIYLKISRGVKASYGEMFGGTKYFWKFLGGSIVYGLIVLGGYLLLIIPGIIWQYKYSMFSYLIIDRDMKITEALKESGRIMYGFKWKMFFLQLLMLAVVIGGLLLLGVGILAAIPIVTLMSVTFYRIVSGEKVNA